MGGALSGGKDILFQNVYTTGTVTGTGSSTYEGVHIGVWRGMSADGNLFYLDNGTANLNKNGSPIAVTSETALVKDTFASLLLDEAWVYVDGVGIMLKAFYENDYSTGDYDSDGTVTNVDITLLVRYLSGVDIGVEAVDLNGDGKINNRDAIYLIKVVAG
jgi:hypothetical protein